MLYPTWYILYVHFINWGIFRDWTKNKNPSNSPLSNLSSKMSWENDMVAVFYKILSLAGLRQRTAASYSERYDHEEHHSLPQCLCPSIHWQCWLWHLHQVSRSAVCCELSSRLSCPQLYVCHCYSPSTPPNRLIFKVNVTDDDVIAPFNSVSLGIEPGPDRAHEMFKIDSRGNIRVSRNLSGDSNEVCDQLLGLSTDPFSFLIAMVTWIYVPAADLAAV